MKAVPTQHNPEQIRRITIGVDVSPLTENPNRSQDAMEAHQRGVISDEALRNAKGFEDDDAPSDEEQIKRLARDGRFPVEVSAQIMGLVSRKRGREQITVQGETTRPPVLPVVSRPTAQPGELHPAQTTPDPPAEPAGPVVAAAAPDPAEGWRVDPAASRRLADIDAALTEWAVTACDAAVQRVVERAGAKVRTAARNDKTITASLAGVDAHLIPATLGRERVEGFVAVTDLIADSYGRLHAQLDTRLADAATQTADAVCDVLGLDTRGPRGRVVHDQVVSRLGTHLDRAWPLLAEALDEAAEDALFPSADPDQQGEASAALISPQAVTDALAAAGGEIPVLTAAGGYGGGRRRRTRRPMKRPGTVPVSGPATGPVARGILAEQGAVTLGWEWQYRVQVPRDTFDPHKQLDGRRFLSWRDPILATDATTAWVGSHFHPKDHRGCMCTASIVVGVVDDPDSALAQALRDAHGDPSRILAAGGTATDTGLRARAMAAADAMRADQITNRKGRRR